MAHLIFLDNIKNVDWEHFGHIRKKKIKYYVIDGSIQSGFISTQIRLPVCALDAAFNASSSPYISQPCGIKSKPASCSSSYTDCLISFSLLAHSLLIKLEINKSLTSIFRMSAI